MNFKTEVEEILGNIFNEIQKQKSEFKRPNCVIISEPIKTGLDIYNKRFGVKTDGLNQLFGLEVIVLARDDIFYLVSRVIKE